MYPSYYNSSAMQRDPVFRRLSSATVTALHKADIKCLEGLFTMKRADILKIPGIGATRATEIMDLLHRLPFDHQHHDLPSNPERDPFAGVHPVLQEYLSGYWYGDETSLRRGENYFQRNRVGHIQLEDDASKTYSAKVTGTQQYHVTLKLESSRRFQSHCTCPAFQKWHYGTTGCKHVVATAMALAEQQRLMRFQKVQDKHYNYRLLRHSLETAASEAKSNPSEPLEYLLVHMQNQWKLYPRRIYPQIKMGARYQYGRNPWNELKPKDPRDRIIVSYLRQIHVPEYYYNNSRKKQSVSFGDTLELLQDRPVFVKREGASTEQVRFRQESFIMQLNIERPTIRTGSGRNNGKADLLLEFRLQSGKDIKYFSEVEVLCGDPVWVLYGTTLARVTGTELALNFFLNSAEESVRVPDHELASFLEDIYPLLQKADIPTRIADELTREVRINPVPRLYLRESGKRLFINLRIAYGDYEVSEEDDRADLLIPNPDYDTPGEPPLLKASRDPGREKEWRETLKETGLFPTSDTHTFSPKELPLEWVLEHLPNLAKQGFEIYGKEQLKKYAPPRRMTSSSMTVTSGEKWFEVEGDLAFGDITVNMSDIHQALIKDKRYIRLQDGSTGELPQDWIHRLGRMLHLLSSGKDKTRLPKIAGTALEELGEMVDDYQTDASFEQYMERLRDFDQVQPVETPDGFRGELRPYQLAGLAWLAFLGEYGFGGILADDMGLGKTIQVLAFLQRHREKTDTMPSALVVAPRSVLHNWETEAGKFLPDCPVYIHHGSERILIPEELPESMLTITTYSTLRNDISILSNIVYDCIVLDESHTIRNPSSKTFRAIRKLQGETRYCLSGTPVQNTTMDLWSQFEFLNPGILGGQKRFRDQWVKPLEQENDTTIEEMIHKMVAPFILRRTKQQVARDLPALTSSRVECDMEMSQQQVYEKYRQIYRALINEEIDTKGIRDSRFTVLEGLTRLRQICCDPSLVDGESGASAKLQRFTELTEELIQEGHRALVFSQFVGFLKLIEDEVQSRGWAYEYLDGQTRNRQERVNRFQSDDSLNLFLISLKAGGEGLNLTGADYVFLMDPWWNPAAERQAMDRTHRIGQEEHVFVYKFVCPGTVEEKILRLQERKRDLAEKLVVAEAGIFKELGRDDLMALFE